MSENITIAIDTMGGDYGVQSAIPGAALVLEEIRDVRFLLYGDESRILPLLDKYPDLKAVSTIHHTDKHIRSDDKPSNALRQSKGSSMRMAIEAVERGEADAIVSSGNTGALMAVAKIVLKMVPGIHRPAIASVFPTLSSETVMLDLGANVLVDAENLVHFAVLGAVFAKVQKSIQKPSVGLLNVGTEETKGPDHVREAGAILSHVEFPGDYRGFVEGNDITAGTVDVVVSDGYAGNIALKTAEGVGTLTGKLLRRSLTADPLSMLGAALATFGIKRLKRKVDPRLYNGGVFLGLNGLCIKSHGGSDALGFSSAVKLAIRLARHGYIKTVSEEINHLTSQESFLARDVNEQ